MSDIFCGECNFSGKADGESLSCPSCELPAYRSFREAMEAKNGELMTLSRRVEELETELIYAVEKRTEAESRLRAAEEALVKIRNKTLVWPKLEASNYLRTVNQIAKEALAPEQGETCQDCSHASSDHGTSGCSSHGEASLYGDCTCMVFARKKQGEKKR